MSEATYEAAHFCTPGCEPGCDIARIRVWTKTEVIERRKPLTRDEIAELLGPDFRADKAARGEG